MNRTRRTCVVCQCASVFVYTHTHIIEVSFLAAHFTITFECLFLFDQFCASCLPLPNCRIKAPSIPYEGTKLDRPEMRFCDRSQFSLAQFDTFERFARSP